MDMLKPWGSTAEITQRFHEIRVLFSNILKSLPSRTTGVEIFSTLVSFYEEEKKYYETTTLISVPTERRLRAVQRMELFDAF